MGEAAERLHVHPLPGREPLGPIPGHRPVGAIQPECEKHGKQVIYTSIGKPRKDDPLYPVYVQFERFAGVAQHSVRKHDQQTTTQLVAVGSDQ